MLKIIILLSAILGTTFSLNNMDYCKIKSCKGPSHTICKYKSKDPAPSCGKVIKVGLTDEEKKVILNLHNEMRQKVANGNEKRGSPGPQPAATNMQQLQWDDELADVAQRWANQCTFDHDACGDVERFRVGQNLGYNATTGDVNSINVEGMVRAWYDEVENYDGKSVSKYSDRASENGEEVGHYTQFVWAKTNRLGCGGIKYPEDDFNHFLLVCNYGPSGNYLGQPVYQTQRRKQWN